MKSYKNISIIGTSHIAIESVKEIESSIPRLRPDLIALELDKKRLGALFARKRRISIKDIKQMGIKGFLFNLVGAMMEQKLGKLVGVKPGSEMKRAFELAKENNIRVALIDQDVSITLRRLSNRLTLKEKLNFFFDIIENLFKKEKIEFDLKKVPSRDVISKLTRKFRKRYPNVYSVLVDERNVHMAKNLYRLMQQYNNIIAIVGAGHEEDLVREIKKCESLTKKR